ncbi:hypothetical protein [Zooshikella sp. RANM57]|uniref:hypothetical protein n=1 Tax=Zooshikella sp. RANM57 TaxID=3425863 RepID=UPI003D701728
MIFRSVAQAWHDAYQDVFITKSRLEPRIRSTASCDFKEIYSAELAKVKSKIERLHKPLYDIGMYTFAPSDQIDNSARRNIESLIWSLFVKSVGSDFFYSITETQRAITLCQYALVEARYRLLSGGKHKYSQRELGHALGLVHTSYARKWKKIFEKMVGIYLELANDALIEVSSVVEKVNASYKEVA